MREYLALGALAVVLAAGCQEYAMDGDEHTRGAAGEELFSIYCTRCHGTDGSGNFLRGVPANRDTDLTKMEIVKLLREGSQRHERMPQFPRLRRSEALALAEYLTVLKERAGKGPFWAIPPVPSH